MVNTFKNINSEIQGTNFVTNLPHTEREMIMAHNTFSKRKGVKTVIVVGLGHFDSMTNIIEIYADMIKQRENSLN